ncbi:hypothetical protein P8452_64670 [Trifolium repens]|nr:hypothetical protein P8452_64670 [Trifolium repens]
MVNEFHSNALIPKGVTASFFTLCCIYRKITNLQRSVSFESVLSLRRSPCLVGMLFVSMERKVVLIYFYGVPLLSKKVLEEGAQYQLECGGMGDLDDAQQGSNGVGFILVVVSLSARSFVGFTSISLVGSNPSRLVDHSNYDVGLGLIIFLGQRECDTDEECYKKYPSTVPVTMICFEGYCRSQTIIMHNP